MSTTLRYLMSLPGENLLYAGDERGHHLAFAHEVGNLLAQSVWLGGVELSCDRGLADHGCHRDSRNEGENDSTQRGALRGSRTPR